MLQLASKTLEV